MRLYRSNSLQVELVGEELREKVLVMDKSGEDNSTETRVDLSPLHFPTDLFPSREIVVFRLEDLTPGRVKAQPVFIHLEGVVTYNGESDRPITIVIGTEYERRSHIKGLSALERRRNENCGLYALTIEKKDKSILKIECERDGDHEFKSFTLSMEIAKILNKKGVKVDYKKYDKVLFVDVVEDKCFIGILLNKNLNKRSYRVKRNKMGLDCGLAACLVKMLDSKKGEMLYDCNCKDGVIGIEAAMQGLKVCCDDDNKNNIRNAEINVKMAEVDVEFKQVKECDYLISYVAGPSAKISENLAKRILEKVKKVKFRKAVIMSNNNWLGNQLKEYEVKERKVKRRGNEFFVYLITYS